MFNGSFTNNNLQYLTGVSEKIPTLFSDVLFIHKSGCYAGSNFSNYFGDTLQSFEYELQAGYQKYFNNGFDIDISYAWHRFSGNTLLEGLNYDHALSMLLGYEINNFYLSPDISYMIGNSNNLFFNMDISRFITVENIFTSNDVFLANPTISFSLGTDHWIYEDLDDTEKNEWFNYLDQAGYAYETFAYQSLNLSLPVSYGIKNIFVTASWLYRIPGAKFKYLGWKARSGFMVSATYFLNFMKGDN